MAILSFTLNPEAVGKFYDSLVCLGKFSESVSIEASRDRLVLTALNSTRSAYASFTLAGNKYFSKYSYTPPLVHGQQSKDKFACKIHNKALIPVFKGRTVDPLREKDISIEKCEVVVEDGPGEVKSRFIIKMICRHGVLKTYRLTFESVAPMHALFRQETIKSSWALSSRALREFVEHFGPKTEQLDIYSDEGRASFTSYTEKIMSGNEVLKQPLHTTVTLDTQEFIEFAVEEKLHIVISVKDFKAIITHAGITNTTVSVSYSYPLSPMQIKYNDEGMSCEFVLMTIGDFRSTSATPAIGTGRGASNKQMNRQPLEASSNRHGTSAVASMPPPPRSIVSSSTRDFARIRPQRPSPPPPQPSLQSNALFFPEEDEDRRWDPANEEDEEMLGWDASASNDHNNLTLSRIHSNEPQNPGLNGDKRSISESSQRLPPTQRMSQIRGIFDD